MIPAGYRRALREHDRRKAIEAEDYDDDKELSLLEIVGIGAVVFVVAVLSIMALANRYGPTVAQYLAG